MTTPAADKFGIQDSQYEFPYHHLVGFAPFRSARVMPWAAEYFSYMDRVIRRLLRDDIRSILDVGCGEGKLFLELRRAGSRARLVGIDLSERAILFARAFNYGNGAEFSTEDVSRAKDMFDAITLIETMEHIPDEYIAATVKGVSDRLAPGGIVVVTVPSDNFPLQEKHYRHYNLPLLRAQFQGFELVEHAFFVRKGILFDLLTRLIRKCATFRSAEGLFFKAYMRFVAPASASTGKHVYAVFKKVTS